ncbi:hypothetical protein WG909_14160 [Peptostreptococcaceae bacterium AGR-M142]
MNKLSFETNLEGDSISNLIEKLENTKIEDLINGLQNECNIYDEFKYAYINSFEYLEIVELQKIKEFIDANDNTKNSEENNNIKDILGKDILDIIEIRFFHNKNKEIDKEQKDILSEDDKELRIFLNRDTVNIKKIDKKSIAKKIEEMEEKDENKKEEEIYFVKEQQVLRKHKFKNHSDFIIEKKDKKSKILLELKHILHYDDDGQAFVIDSIMNRLYRDKRQYEDKEDKDNEKQ